MNHVEIRDLVSRIAPELTPAESLAARAVAWHETRYGLGWKNDGVGSFNMGAITVKCGTAPSFKYEDSRFDAEKNAIVKYETCFRKYVNESDGMRDVIRTALRSNVRDLLAKKGLRGVAEGMYANKYYLGTAPDAETNIQRYHQALESAVNVIRRDTREPVPFVQRAPEFLPPPSQQASRFCSLPELSEGSRGDAVSLWQRAIGVRDDGIFGPITAEATKRYQATKGLPPTGVVNAESWREFRFSLG